MDREGLSKIRRTELLARLVQLDQQIEAQLARVRHVQSMGWDVTLSMKRLTTLEESRRLYRSALKHLLGDDSVADPTAGGE
jgi:hypothetical protein